MQQGRCAKCHSENVVTKQCVECSNQMCHMCISFAGQCASCAAKSHISPFSCDVCNDFANGQGLGLNFQKCMHCRRWICDACSKSTWPQQQTSDFCSRCESSLCVSFTCTRCRRLLEETNDRYFCELCGGAVCRGCLPVSFESGVVKCRLCCPAPIRLNNKPPIRTVLDDGVKTLVESLIRDTRANASAPAQSGAYERLFNRVKLGGGGQGVVYKCTTEDGEDVVLKEMWFPQSSRATFEERLYQAEKMRKLSHKHLIRYLDVFGSTNPFKISVVMPYYSEGDLNKFVRRQKDPIEEHKLCSIILQITGALEYLSSQNPPLTHCDIKPENILLLSKEEQVLLMDLDLCRSFDAQPSRSERDLDDREEDVSPTFEYRAPELARSVGSPKSDIFSLGVVAFVLATLPEFAMLTNSKGETVVLSDSDWTTRSLSIGVRRAILSHTRKYSDALIDLINKMLLHDPKERPEATTVRFELTKIMEERLLRSA